VAEKTRVAMTTTLRLLRPDAAAAEAPVVIAPMVNQSELAYRRLVRKVAGPRLCYTPMIHARMFVEGSEKYRRDQFETCAEDRPLIAQFCGHDPVVLLAAGKLVQDRCDGVDINLGCPQKIAKRGRYGAYLLKDADLLERIVSTLSQGLRVPVSCKIRLVTGPDLEPTLELARRLERAGCKLLTVHGRFLEQNKHLVGSCDWDAIRRIKQVVSIPVVANGGIATPDDARACVAATGVDGVMSCEAVLENPTLFATSGAAAPLSQFDVVRAYLDLADAHASGQPKAARAHIFKFLYGCMTQHPDFFPKFGLARDVPGLRAVCEELFALHSGDAACTHAACGSWADSPWYHRHRRGAVAGGVDDGGEPPAKRAMAMAMGDDE